MPGENQPRRVWNKQTKFTYNHWLAALVKGKCTSTKPTHLATGVVCHPDTEQNRPYKIPWSCQGLNRGPTAPQARTLPVCHTTPIFYPGKKFLVSAAAHLFCIYQRNSLFPFPNRSCCCDTTHLNDMEIFSLLNQTTFKVFLDD